MCILAIQYKSVPEAPILVAANRDEFYDRPSTTPSIQSGKPRILSGVVQQAGGTWLGVGVLRWKHQPKDALFTSAGGRSLMESDGHELEKIGIFSVCNRGLGGVFHVSIRWSYTRGTYQGSPAN